MKRHKTRFELIEQAKHERKFTDAVWRVNLLVTLIILHDIYDFDAERLREFVDKYSEVLEYYNNSNDYNKLIDEWDRYFNEYAGINVLKEVTRKLSDPNR